MCTFEITSLVAYQEHKVLLIENIRDRIRTRNHRESPRIRTPHRCTSQNNHPMLIWVKGKRKYIVQGLVNNLS